MVELNDKLFKVLDILFNHFRPNLRLFWGSNIHSNV